MDWVLIIYIYAGVLAKGDSVALATIPMASHELCKKAADEADKLSANSTKITRTVCVRAN